MTPSESKWLQQSCDPKMDQWLRRSMNKLNIWLPEETSINANQNHNACTQSGQRLLDIPDFNMSKENIVCFREVQYLWIPTLYAVIVLFCKQNSFLQK